MADKTSTYIYRVQPARKEMLTQGATAEEDLIISEHFTFLEKLKDQGIVLLAGRTPGSDPSAFGLILLKVKSEDSARRIMLSDPAVERGVMRAELFPFRIALCSNAICTDDE